MERRNENDGEEEVLFEDVFPGYPSGLKMKADLAKFVSQRTILHSQAKLTLLYIIMHGQFSAVMEYYMSMHTKPLTADFRRFIFPVEHNQLQTILCSNEYHMSMHTRPLTAD